MGIAALAEELERVRRAAEAAERALGAEREARLALEQLVRAANERADAAIERADLLATSNEELAQKLAHFELRRSGPKSERFVDPAQLSLLVASELEPPPRLPQVEDSGTSSDDRDKERNNKKGARGPRRRDLAQAAHLPACEVRCAMDPAARCAGCGEPLRVIGQSEAWRLHWVPGHFERLHVVRDKCACPSCPSEGVLTVPDPFVLPRALCSNGLLAAVLVDKFADHLPLNRQAKRMERVGVPISTAVLSAWVFAVAHPSQGLLSRVAAAILAELLQASALRGDDTGHPVQDGVDGGCAASPGPA